MLILSIQSFVFCGVFFECVFVMYKCDPHTFGQAMFYDLLLVNDLLTAVLHKKL